MTDERIIELFNLRDEKAILGCEELYGKYCMAITRKLLLNEEDSKEIINEVYLRVWNSIPPAKPHSLKLYLGKITRNLSIDFLRREGAAKRSANFVELLEEMSDCCLEDENTVEKEILEKEQKEEIFCFLNSLKENEKDVFLCRYYRMDSIEEIASNMGYSKGKVKSMLRRTRIKLKKYMLEGR